MRTPLPLVAALAVLAGCGPRIVLLRPPAPREARPAEAEPPAEPAQPPPIAGLGGRNVEVPLLDAGGRPGPEFAWSVDEPPGGARAEYSLEVSRNELFAGPFDYRATLVATTTHRIPHETRARGGGWLASGPIYYWRVRAGFRDAEGEVVAKAVSETRAFKIEKRKTVSVSLRVPTGTAVTMDGEPLGERRFKLDQGERRALDFDWAGPAEGGGPVRIVASLSIVGANANTDADDEVEIDLTAAKFERCAARGAVGDFGYSVGGEAVARLTLGSRASAASRPANPSLLGERPP